MPDPLILPSDLDPYRVLAGMSVNLATVSADADYWGRRIAPILAAEQLRREEEKRREFADGEAATHDNPHLPRAEYAAAINRPQPFASEDEAVPADIVSAARAAVLALSTDEEVMESMGPVACDAICALVKALGLTAAELDGQCEAFRDIRR
jgi:hypothetical protein